LIHLLFAERFREAGEAETRVIHIITHEHGVPPGKYALLEFYCNDYDCDCRQVYLQVFSDQNKTIEAVISYGWEPIEFYQEWNHGVLDETIAEFKGPALASIRRQGIYAEKWLEIVSELLTTDQLYAQRLEQHYTMMKRKS
jgi:hypothetical protein